MDRFRQYINKSYTIVFLIICFITLENNLYSEFTINLLCKEDFIINNIEKNGLKLLTSTTMNSHGSINYQPENLLDKNKSTCWCTSDANSLNEYIIFEIPKGVKGLRFVNGVAKTDLLFYKNNRIKNIYLGFIIERIKINGKNILPNLCPKNQKYTLFYHTNENDLINLKDTNEPQEVLFEKIKGFSWDMDFFKITKKVYIVVGIAGIYKGSKYNDTCISDIEIIK